MIKQFFTLTICIILGVLSELSAQDFSTFELKSDGETYVVTQDIDPTFLGTYIQKRGKNKLQCQIATEEGKSFLLKMIDTDKESNFEWDLDNKKEISWGLVIEDGKLSETQVMEYAGGRMVSYNAYVIIIQERASGTILKWMLYELDGKKFLGQAEKIEVVAENR